ncbi:MAG: hypothetical protein JWQ40_4258 [Segetibacter sp.]|nr:hypothetical protein [Segetibacter sp.]
MKRHHQKNFRISTIIKRAVVITVILALIEVVFIFFFMSQKKEKSLSVSKAKEKPAPTLTASLNDTVKTSSRKTTAEIQNYKDIADTKKTPPVKEENPAGEQVAATGYVTQQTPSQPLPEKPKEKLPPPVTILQGKPIVKEVKQAKLKPADTSASTKTLALAPVVEKPVLKQLSQQKMAEILNKIQSEKNKNKNASNCIQIQKTNTSNVENAFAIAKFLNSNGFIISGRLTVPGSQEGFHIEAVGSCIKLTIGSL